ncbi:TetR/AcrR family transcriptional regulator [Antarcticimicrobium luteum]|uniref:TetR family transcriptional regulator n=1 Tax=Antarcticimicrobium luteum TaxID=2547397 RepID=A0A4R5UX26_9RHOB|nr:TetR/AcrR family transcriptional regulator [Antarcticimicrobium luteum]TDK43839.1 TetR family transcriptional regulator [Antarcticimicrobium luteum]
MTTKRRSQSERREQTRNALIDATTELLMERGMQGAAVQEICKRAGVTTGAIQHQFGSKTGLIAEVVETLFTSFADDIPAIGEADLSLEERVARVVDHYWSIYGGERYFAVLEILLATRHDPSLMTLVSQYRSRNLSALEHRLLVEFPDVDLPPSELKATVQRMMDYLRGHALRRLYQSDATLDRQALDHARKMVLTEFEPRQKART